jgi:hypothetical protein
MQKEKWNNIKLQLENQLHSKKREELDKKDKENLNTLSDLKTKITFLEAEKKSLEETKKKDIEAEKNKLELEFQKEKNDFTTEIQTKDKEIALLKDFRVKQSTKMI